MKAFKQMLRYIWPQWPRIIVVVLSALVIAVLLSLSFVTIIPLLKVMMGEEGLHGWVDRKSSRRLLRTAVPRPRARRADRRGPSPSLQDPSARLDVAKDSLAAEGRHSSRSTTSPMSTISRPRRTPARSVHPVAAGTGRRPRPIRSRLTVSASTGRPVRVPVELAIATPDERGVRPESRLDADQALPAGRMQVGGRPGRPAAREPSARERQGQGHPDHHGRDHRRHAHPVHRQVLPGLSRPEDRARSASTSCGRTSSAT